MPHPLNAPSPPIAITLGDPAGIGPEVVARSLPENSLIIGPAAALERAFRLIGGARPRIVRVSAPEDIPEHLPEGPLPVLDTHPGGIDLPPLGAPCAAGGRLAMAALERATDLALAGRVSALVTAPVSKEAVRLAGLAGFTGHTEYLARRAGDVPVRMMMACPALRVVLATTHHALADLPGLITADGVFETIRQTHDALRFSGIDRPRIAVCGLNPHPGEFGTEDAAQVAPAIERARAAGIDADGPHAADALFPHVVNDHSHDAVVAMYHDQGLVPVKLLGFTRTVNITLGLPFVRTSPGHGTAFGIAARGQANADSMRAALDTARAWAARRTPHPVG